jgi:hypothetical protein
MSAISIVSLVIFKKNLRLQMPAATETWCDFWTYNSINIFIVFGGNV